MLVALLAELGKERLRFASAARKSSASNSAFISIIDKTVHWSKIEKDLLLEALALDVAQLLCAGAHDIVGWRNIRVRLSRHATRGLETDGPGHFENQIHRNSDGRKNSLIPKRCKKDLLLAAVQLGLQGLTVMIHR